MSRLSLRCVCVCAILFAGLCPSGALALSIGAGDQTPAMFSDPRFQALGIRYARLDVPWNVVEQSRELERVRAWLAAARADQVTPLITFDHAHTSRWHHTLPSAARYGQRFARFHALFPWVKDFATWNEANYCGEPTCHHPATVARYYLRIAAICRSCRVLGAELLDEPNMTEWVDQFRDAMGGSEPKVWGLHNYLGANRLSTATTKALIKATRVPIWFTETGGLVSRHNHSSIGFPESIAHAAKVTSFLFEVLARLSPRIKRIYIYQWDGAGPGSTWDSGLIAPSGLPRPAYDVFVRALQAFGQLPTTAAAASILKSVTSG